MPDAAQHASANLRAYSRLAFLNVPIPAYHLVCARARADTTDGADKLAVGLSLSLYPPWDISITVAECVSIYAREEYICVYAAYISQGSEDYTLDDARVR